MEHFLYAEEILRNQRQRVINLYCTNDCTSNGTDACKSCPLKIRQDFLVYNGSAFDRNDPDMPSFLRATGRWED